jgi:hypothetical protein
MGPRYLTGFRPTPDSMRASQPKFGSVRKDVEAWTEGEASDLRRFSPARHDQSHSSSCVAQSVVRAAEVQRIKKLFKEALASGLPESEALASAKSGHVPLSRLALYYAARELMDPQEVDKDEGTYVVLAAEAMRSAGVCREEKDRANPSDRSYWPFDLKPDPGTGKSKVFSPPSWSAMREAYLHKISAWHRMETEGEERVRDVIIALGAGCPVVYGAKVDRQWMAYDGSSPLGLMREELIGGHATVLLGWDPSRRLFLGENSWGPAWGVKGPDGTGGFYEVTEEKIASDESDDFVVMEGGWEPWRKK